jgi:hypothetical protein
MYKRLAIVLVILVFSVAGNAQVMAAKKEWITIKSANLKCWECKEKLEKYLTSENESTMESGIIQRRYNLISGEIRIQYYPDRVTPDVIRTVLNNAGYDADDTKAEPEAYKKLAPICKRAEDGGGPQKGKPCHIQPFN